jgi:hypothetical protein
VKAIEAAIKTVSVNTNHAKRDAHLRNADFFDVRSIHDDLSNEQYFRRPRTAIRWSGS